MATSYTSLLGLALPVTGELSGTWGDTVNNYITQYIDASVAGTQTISGSLTAVTLSKTTNAALSQAGSGATGSSQYQIINCTGNPASELTVTVPAASKEYIVINATSTSQNVKIVGAGPTAGVTVVSGERCLIAWNGSDFVKIGGTNGAGSFTTLNVTGNSTLGDAVGDTVTVNGTATFVNANPTLSAGTANGVAYLNGSKVLTTGSALTFDGTNFNAPASIVSGSIGGIYAISYGAGNQQTWLLNNATASDTYRQSDTAQRFRMLTGVGFAWETAASGTAGGAITWSEQMRLTSTGLGIGTSSFTARLAVSAAKATVQVTSTTGTNGAYQAFTNTGGNFYTGMDSSTGGDFAAAYAGVMWHGGAYPLLFGTSNLERMRLDSSGNLGLGVTPSAWYSTYKAFDFGAFGGIATSGPGTTILSANYYVNASNAVVYKGNGYAGGYNIRVDNGEHRWFVGPNNTSGAGAALTFTQAMTLDASGNLGIGTTSPSPYSTNSRVVHIDGGANAAELKLTNNTSGASGATGAILQMTGNDLYIWNAENSFLSLGTNNTERVRIDYSGNLLVGKTDAAFTTKGMLTAQAGYIYAGVEDDYSLVCNRFGSDGTQISFRRSSTQVGSVSVTTTATAYNTSSDYRLKDITGPVTNSGAYIDSLKPVEGTWKADGSTFVGLIAHEVQEVSRTQVATGEKDGEQMQAMDYSSAEIIANLIAEVQSLRKRIAALEAK